MNERFDKVINKMEVKIGSTIEIIFNEILALDIGQKRLVP